MNSRYKSKIKIFEDFFDDEEISGTVSDVSEPGSDGLSPDYYRPFGIVDTYTDGKFYRDGEEIFTPLEIANNEIDSLTQQLGEAVEAIYQADMSVIG